MAKNSNLQQEIDLLEQSKYNVGEERSKGFIRAAIPALVTFGAIGAVAGAAVALFTGAGFGAIAGVSLLTGLSASAASGGIASLSAGRKAEDKNKNIEKMELRIKQEALEHNIDVSLPEQQNHQTTVSPKHTEGHQRPKFLEDIIEKGQKTFDPREIAGRTVNDAREAFKR